MRNTVSLDAMNQDNRPDRPRYGPARAYRCPGGSAHGSPGSANAGRLKPATDQGQGPVPRSKG